MSALVGGAYDDLVDVDLGRLRHCVAGFRLGHGTAPDDPCVRQVLGELLDISPEFTEM
ncbi:hypothetical protein [Streptomyces spectabilis]|uniref:Uncharacterized protein n=1 Tax=Streptomyces spectabilis TaxID=68270 RepID=A0A7W8B213_STRST|nr:hypothetical protein [Streptomyces spectabilis]MBB5107467.1 hypothetical protein [Streptomyces spectabilis]MCI3900154.1 hypothetical protein [Streptomyces spectabilis]